MPTRSVSRFGKQKPSWRGHESSKTTQVNGGYRGTTRKCAIRVPTMTRSIILAAVLGVLAALPTLFAASGPVRQNSVDVSRGDEVSQAAITGEAWPICTSMDFAEGPVWAPLDPEFAAGKRALAAGDWQAAIRILTLAALRDDRNGDIQNYLG